MNRRIVEAHSEVLRPVERFFKTAMNRMVQTCESCFRELKRFVNISTHKSDQTQLLCSRCFSKKTNMLKRVLRAFGIKRQRRSFDRHISSTDSLSREDHQTFVGSKTYGSTNKRGSAEVGDSRGTLRGRCISSSGSVRHMFICQAGSTPKQVRTISSSPLQGPITGFRPSEDQKGIQKRNILSVLSECHVSKKPLHDSSEKTVGMLRSKMSPVSLRRLRSRRSLDGLSGMKVQDELKNTTLAKRSVHWADEADGQSLETLHLFHRRRTSSFNFTACFQTRG